MHSSATSRPRRTFRCSRCCQRGTAIVETVIALPILLVVILGSIQFGLIYEAKATLNHASLQAARAGAVSHAQPDAIRRGLARGLVPLYSPQSSLQGFAGAAARIDAGLLADARIRILNPTREAFADFGEEVDGVREIPNDRLHVRSTATGTQSGLNIQDANVLKVEVTYGYELKVPLVNWFISRVLLAVRRGGAAMDAFEQQLLRRTLLPIVATSTVRMQSPARMSDAIVARGDLPDVDRIPSDARPVPATEDESRDGRAENGGESGDGDEGSSLGEGFFGYGGGPADGSGGGSIPGNGGAGSGSGDGSGGGGNSGNPQTCPVDGEGGEGSNAAAISNVTLPSLSVGNPIHVVTGNKYQAELDLAALPGTLGIAFARHYNSEAAAHAGVMGAGWRHDYETSIRVSDGGASIDLWQADGRHLAFNRSDDSGTYAAQRAGDGEVRIETGGYRWLWPNARELRFDSAGRLVSVREGARRLTLEYNDARQLTRIIDPQLRALRVDYYPNGRVSRVQSVAGAAWHYAYDEAGNLAQVISADGSVRRYEYEDARHPHHLTGISGGTLRLDDYGNRNRFQRIATWAYDARGRAILSSHLDDAGKVTLEYGNGYTDVTDAFGRITRLMTTRRNGVALVMEVRGPGCGSCGQADVRYEYNGHFQLTEVAAKYAPTLRYQYDDRQRLSQVERRLPGAANEWRVRYRYAGNAHQPTRIERPSIKPGAGSATEMAYRPDGQLLSVRESGYAPGQEVFVPIERTVTFDYDAAGNLISLDGPRNDVSDVTHFTYDAQGRPGAIRRADGIEWRVSAYDPAGRPSQVERTGRPAIRLEYDVAGRVTGVTEVRAAGERSVHYGYDHLGRLQTIRRPDGRTQRITYDVAGRPTRLVSGDSGLATALTYAPDGNISHAAILSRHGVPVRVLHYAFDAELRLKEVRDGDGPPLRQFTYVDDGAQPDRVIDPLGFETAFNYDATGHVDSILAADGGTTRFTRDATGRLVGVTAPNDAHTQYSYDDFGRRVREDSADRGVTHYAYDVAGNLVERTDAKGQKTRFAYDAANRLIEVFRREGTTRLSYDHGHLTKISGPSSEERSSYDADGQLGTHTKTIAGHLFKTGYRYDAQGRLEVRTLPSGQRLRYHYAQNGSLRTITLERLFDEQLLVGSPESATNSGPAMSIDALGDLIYGNGLAANTSYAADGRIERRTTDGVSTLEYQYDPSGRIVRVKDSDSTRSYDYDAMGRLTAARTPFGQFSYAYDANGNRLSAAASLSAIPVPFTREGASQTYAYAQHSNRLLAIHGVGKISYRHDAAGNPTDIANRRYEYNTAGRLARFYLDNRLTAEYRYNLAGERISKTSFAGAKPRTTLYIYEDQQLMAEADARGKVVREYLYLGQHPVAMLDRGAAYWIHTDHLGAPVAVTDKDRRVVWSARYKPFGEATVEEDPDGDAKRLSLNLRFPGQYADAESGTNYNVMRDYDPRSGRYVTSDPIGLNGGANPFAYAGQDPVNAIDPLGLYLFAFDGTWINRSSGVLTNVELFRRYYDPTFEEVNSFYRAGLGTGDPNQSDFENSVDRVLGGAFGLGGQDLISLALAKLDVLIAGTNDGPVFDGIIDIVGFSRGAATGRAFANVIYARLDEGYYSRALRSGGTCRSLRIRFMGLFDTVGSFGVPGNSVDLGYDFRIDSRVGTVAHAVALNEHRAAFDLLSIQNAEHSSNTTPYREERGFIGAHSDIGGGYSTGDLSDLALQWMYKAAVAAGLRMAPIGSDHLVVTSPIIHDERGVPQDREIFYPNDPNWIPAVCTEGPIACLLWTPPATQRQLTAPQFQFPELSDMINENPQPGAVRGTVDMQRYRSWLRNRGQL